MWAYLFSLFFVLTGAAIQEFTLHERPNANEGNSFIFRGPLADTSNPIFANVTRICQTSYTYYYSEVNFMGTVNVNADVGRECHGISLSYWKSIRFAGNKNTGLDGVSLYPLTNTRGQEIYIDHSPFAGINSDISSLGWTGSSNWTLFEGNNFDGNYVCIPGVHSEGASSHIPNLQSHTNLKTVGSLVKSCLTNVMPAMLEDLRRQVNQR